MAKEQLPKIKVTQIATELGIKPKDVVAKAAEVGIVIKSVNSSVEEKTAEDIYNYVASGVVPQIAKPKPAAKKPKAKDSVKDSAKDAESKGAKAKTKAKKDGDSAESKSAKATKAKDSTEGAKAKDGAESIDEKPVKMPEVRKIIIVSTNKKDSKAPSQEQIISATEALDEIIHDQPSTPTPTRKPATKPKPKDSKPKPKPKPRTTGNETIIEMERGFGKTALEGDDEIMMVDFSEIDERSDYKEERITDKVRIQRKNPWFFDNVSRDRRRNRSKSSHHRKESSATSKQDSVQGIIAVPEEIRVYEFADKLGVRVTEVISKLFKMGEMVTKNDFLDATTMEILAGEFHTNIQITKSTQELEYLESLESAAQELVLRAPVVTIMGHVDHGKTSLLDYIRNSRISKSEEGGITQHIGAYMVNRNGRDIAFIDTPGHEAFANMRSRGAQITDIAVIVIAADDGVKQQTKEALAHAKDANVQIIIAMNKMDKENANPDKLKAEMAEIGYNPADWGGEYDFVPVSAKSGEGVENLLDTILLQAEIMDLKANIASQAKAVVIEGSLDKGKGPIVTAIVQEGILKVGDSVVADTAYGKIRALIDDNGRNLSELRPSQIAVLVGLSEVPSAGAILVSVSDDATAKQYAMKRKSYLRTRELSKSTKVSFDELSSVVAQGRLKPLHLILKADTQGSLEAVKSSLEALSNDEIAVNIISSSVGNITENDIAIAAGAKNCYILGFNVKPLAILKSRAKEQNVVIKSHSVIYHLLDDVKAIIATMMTPIMEEEIVGNLEVRDIFSIGKGNVIAGCFVLEGVIERNSQVRLLRGDKEIYKGNLSSLKRFKDDVKEVAKGYECGVMLESFNDIKVGDSMEIIKAIFKQQQI